MHSLVRKRISALVAVAVAASAMAFATPASSQQGPSALDPWGLGVSAAAEPAAIRDFDSTTTARVADPTSPEHCAVLVEADPLDDSRLIASTSEICFQDSEVRNQYLSDNGILRPTNATPVAANTAFAQAGAPFVIGEHFEDLNFGGSSLTLSGVDCVGGGLSLIGSAWNNRIRSTRNGCALIAHYDGGDPAPYDGPIYYTSFPGGNLNSQLDQRTSGIRYFGGDIFDRDGDALLDTWEINGIDFNGDGQIDLDLPAMGADPLRKDVFLEIDWEAGDGPECRWTNSFTCDGGRDSSLPSFAELTEILRAFDQAPVSNPDGSTGVTLHLDAGPLFPMYLDGPQWGSLSDSSILNLGNIGTTTASPGCQYLWTEFDQVKGTHFVDELRSGVFHYAVVAPNYSPASGCPSDLILGAARAIPSSDFVAFNNHPSGHNSRDIALTIMHELGHTLGLQHGGDQGFPQGPNFVSIMNYLHLNLGGVGQVGSTRRSMDYSPTNLGILDESSLNESTGLPSPIAFMSIDYYCPERDENFVFPRRQVAAGPEIDWDCDGNNTETNVTSNNLGGIFNNDTTTAEIYHSRNDWASLEFAGGWVGNAEFQQPQLPTISAGDPQIDPTLRPAAFSVTIGSVLLALANDPNMVVTGLVSNIGTDAITIDFEIVDSSGAPIATTSMSLDAGATETVSLTIPALAGEYQLFAQAAGEDWVSDTSSFSVGIQTQIPPMPLSDSYNVSNNQTTVLDVLGNDQDGDDPIDPGTLTIVVAPAGVAAVGGGTISYSSPTAGADMLTYEVCDLNGICSQATVAISVDDAPQSPNAVDDAVTVLANETVTIDVLGNDVDPDDDLDESTLTIASVAASGTATVVDNGQGLEIEYTAGPVSGTDSFSYEVCDETGLCDQASVLITILAESACTIIGTSGDNTLIGTSGDDVICGLEGDDVIFGLGGNDVIFGGNGADIIHGGDGDDTILGGRGADELNGDAGNDEISGNRGADVIAGGAGNDVLWGNRGADTIRGGDGADVIRGGKGHDLLRGNLGNDVIYAGKGSDELWGGAGDDELRARRGDDVLRGGAGDDFLYGGDGSDDLRGGSGNDELYGRRGADYLRGGSGSDLGRGGRGWDVCTDFETSFSCEA